MPQENKSPIGNSVNNLAQQGAQLQPVVVVGDTIRIDISRLRMGVMNPFSNGEVHMWVVLRSNTSLEIYIPNLAGPE